MCLWGKPLIAQTPKIENPEISKMVFIQGNSLVGVASPIYLNLKIQVLATITAYNPVEWQTDSTPQITASGKIVEKGYIACPSWLPFGTLVEIEGNFYECQDRMSPKYWNEWRFDILFFDLNEAKKFGIQKQEVKIYK